MASSVHKRSLCEELDDVSDVGSLFLFIRKRWGSSLEAVEEKRALPVCSAVSRASFLKEEARK